MAPIGPAATVHRWGLLEILAQDTAHVLLTRLAAGRFLTTHSWSMAQCSKTILWKGSPEPTRDKSKTKSKDPKDSFPKWPPAIALSTFICLGDIPCPWWPKVAVSTPVAATKARFLGLVTLSRVNLPLLPAALEQSHCYIYIYINHTICIHIYIYILVPLVYRKLYLYTDCSNNSSIRSRT